MIGTNQNLVQCNRYMIGIWPLKRLNQDSEQKNRRMPHIQGKPTSQKLKMTWIWELKTWNDYISGRDWTSSFSSWTKLEGADVFSLSARLEAILQKCDNRIGLGLQTERRWPSLLEGPPPAGALGPAWMIESSVAEPLGSFLWVVAFC